MRWVILLAVVGLSGCEPKVAYEGTVKIDCAEFDGRTRGDIESGLERTKLPLRIKQASFDTALRIMKATRELGDKESKATYEETLRKSVDLRTEILAAEEEQARLKGALKHCSLK